MAPVRRRPFGQNVPSSAPNAGYGCFNGGNDPGNPGGCLICAHQDFVSSLLNNGACSRVCVTGYHIKC